MKRFAVLLLLAASLYAADTGVIIPAGKQAPDASELAIESLHVRIEMDNGHATVYWDEVFHNKTARVLEGTYLLTLPESAAISNFAVWDDLTRIPGVILERKRAGELYDQIRNETIDPALLESGEITESNAPGEARHSTQFSVKIVPIPAYGYKRIEAEYRQLLPVNDLASELVVPLKSSSAQAIGKLSIELQLQSPDGISSFASPNYDLKLSKHEANDIQGSFEASAAPLDRDLVVQYRVGVDRKPRVQSYRDPAVGSTGYFEASAILPSPEKPQTASKTVLLAFDTSLSMQWEKLERGFRSLETILHALQPADRFEVMVFNSDVALSSPAPVPATTENVAHALEFVRASRLKGGTNLQKTLAEALQAAKPGNYIVLLTDGGVTEGLLSPAKFHSWFEKAWTASSKPCMYALALGDDANAPLLKSIAAHNGLFEQIGSTEAYDFKLQSFVHKIGVSPLDDVELTVPPRVQPKLVYRVETENFPGVRASWVGEYEKPGLGDVRIANEVSRASFPEKDVAHPYLPAAWARARVDALLEKINNEGEDKASIDEIIALSRQYHFVTPYTSFLAAPRALLRPRLIRPGDPLLRVRTDPSIESVVALFPFGLVKPLRYLGREDIWQTRFLAPDDLADGVHTVRLILRDRAGHTYREQKTFVISSQPPLVRVHLPATAIHAGASVPIKVQASATTRTITVRLYGTQPLLLAWNESQKSNTGSLSIPSDLPVGRYSLHVTAEDMAHNVSQQEVPIDVVP